MLTVPPLLARDRRIGTNAREGSDAFVWKAERLWIATDTAGIGLWSWNVDTDEIAMDDRAHALWGGPRDGPFTFADLSARIAPPDLDRVKTAFQATRTTPGPYQIDFRILRPDGIRWVSARGWGADEGIVGRIMFGVFLDSTARKAADGAREMLAGDTLGNHDMVLVYETPDDDVAARFSLMLNCLGAVRTKTMKAFPEGAYRQIVASLQ